MLKIDKFVTASPEQWEIIIEGMRNPMNSWAKSDSHTSTFGVPEWGEECEDIFVLGPNDLDLMTRLNAGGPVHAKYRRMIPVYVTLTAPLYWWKEMDTYKVGTVCNSCSTMHKIHSKEFELEDFSTEHLIGDWIGDHNDAMYYWRPMEIKDDWFASPMDGLKLIIGLLNSNRKAYLECSEKLKHKYFSDWNEGIATKRAQKEYWWQMIQLLPTSYNQKRTLMLNYEVLHNIYHSRKNHKLDEWHTFCHWIEELPYSELIIGKEE